MFINQMYFELAVPYKVRRFYLNAFSAVTPGFFERSTIREVKGTGSTMGN